MKVLNKGTLSLKHENEKEIRTLIVNNKITPFFLGKVAERLYLTLIP